MSFADFVYRYPFQILFLTIIFFIAIIVFFILYITKKKVYSKKIYQIAYMDSMTGLWNINRFEADIPKLIKENEENDFAIISMDMKHFKMVNSVYGRVIGDKVICYISDCIKKEFRKGTVAAHIRADKFIVLVPCNSEAEVKCAIEQFYDISKLFYDGNVAIRILYSSGVYYLSNESSVSLSVAIDYAEMARREAKNKNESVVFYDKDMQLKISSEKDIEEIMQRALIQDEFKVFFQPKYDIKSNEITGAEALCRWISPDKGFLNPDDFIPIFERNGFIVELDFYVLNQVCKLIRTWIDNDVQPLCISVNQSRAHFEQADYFERLETLINTYKVPKGLIELELKETTLMDESRAKEMSDKLKKIGFKLSMDDFGSGYSSLKLLQTIPFDVVKIDRKFFASSTKSENSRIVLKKIIEMANEMKIDVICEGVEQVEQAQFLLDVGCHVAQGFYFARPMTQEDFLLISKRKILDSKWKQEEVLERESTR